MRVANAPVSYGAFELTVGTLPNVPQPEQVLDAIAAAGYEGTELGPPGYLGEGETLRERLRRRGLQLAGAFVELRFGDGDLAPLAAIFDLLEGFDAQPILCDRGPRDGDVDLDGVARAVELARTRGLEPSFHHHMGTRVQTPAEIERLLEGTDVALLLDSGHLAAAGGDAVQGARDWRHRVRHVHVKDIRLDVVDAAPTWGDAWRAGAFCELGTGDVDLEELFAELAGYSGWVVVEQDWLPAPGDELAAQIEAQARNRRWLAERVGL
ncbi:MAG: TIM barrel protein [Actinobacteria bacterium]|nr:TIM barrel protein [Actinomycetota bacterium]